MMQLTEGANLATLGPGSRALTEGFYTWFLYELEEAKTTLERIFEIRTSKKRSETDAEFVGTTMAQLATIAGQSEFESPFDGGTKQIDMLLFKKAYQVAEQDVEDDLYGLLEKVARSLPVTFVRRAESLAAGHVASIFSATTGFDGVPICSTAHPFPPGRPNMTTGAATWSNRLAVDAALSPENLQSLQILLRQTRTREGAPAGLRGKVLLHPVELEGRAHEILKSTYKAYTDTNEVNVFGQGGLWPIEPISWEWLPSATAYFLIDPDHSPFYWYWRQRPLFRDQTEINSGVYQYFGVMRCAPGSSEPRGLAATPGA